MQKEMDTQRTPRQTLSRNQELVIYTRYEKCALYYHQVPPPNPQMSDLFCLPQQLYPPEDL